jgi:ATP-dependent RNA helicase RhlE
LTTQFSQFSLSPALMARLDANKFEIPTPVQAGCIPPALEGRDVLATAQTGTGKTLGFLIPIVEMLQKAEGKGAQALILLPTRELAMQVEQAFLAIRSSSAQTVALVVGGLAERSQLDAIRRGARLIVATPGRLEDYLKRKLVRLDQVKILVLDEVDRMLDMGFQPAIARIAATLPPVRQTLCYSATLEGAVKEVARKYLNNPVRVEIGSVLKPAENVELRTFEVEPDKKQELLEHLLGAETGQLSGLRAHQARRRPRGAPAVRSGWSATQIHGDRSQAQRNAGPAQLLRGPSPRAGGHRRCRSRHRRGQRGARDQLRHAQGGRGLCPPRRPHRPRLGARRGFHLCRTGGARRPAQDRAHAVDPDEALPGALEGQHRGEQGIARIVLRKPRRGQETAGSRAADGDGGQVEAQQAHHPVVLQQVEGLSGGCGLAAEHDHLNHRRQRVDEKKQRGDSANAAEPLRSPDFPDLFFVLSF